MNIFIPYKRKSNLVFIIMTFEIIITVFLLLLATILAGLETFFDWDLKIITWFVVSLIFIIYAAFLYIRYRIMRNITIRLQKKTSSLSKNELILNINKFIKDIDTDIEKNRIKHEIINLYEMNKEYMKANKISKILIKINHFFRFT